MDGGAYLIGLNQLLGTDTSGITGPGLPRLILGPGLLLWPFVEAFGINYGMRIFAAVASVLPIAAVYLLARKVIGVRWSMVAAGTVTFDLWQAEIMITGTDPLIGYALVLVAMWAVTECHNWRGRVTLAFALPLIAHTSMTAAGIAAIVLPVFTMAWWWYGRKISCWCRLCWWRENMAQILIPVAIGLLLALTALPWYLPQMPGGATTAYDGPVWYPAPLWDSTWYMLLWEIPSALFILWRLRNVTPGLKAVGMTMLVIIPVWMAWSYDESLLNVMYRMRHFSMLLFWIGAAAILRQWWPAIRRDRIFQFMFAWVAVLLLLAWPMSIGRERKIANTVSWDGLAAIEIIKATPNGVITNAGGLSFWAGALAGVDSEYAQVHRPPKTFLEDYERLGCVMGWRGECDAVAWATEMGMGYVLIDERIYRESWRLPPIYGAPAEPWVGLDGLPWLEKVYERGDVRLWRITD